MQNKYIFQENHSHTLFAKLINLILNCLSNTATVFAILLLFFNNFTTIIPWINLYTILLIAITFSLIDAFICMQRIQSPTLFQI